MNPGWITGFIDGEGCFHVTITENKELSQGWEIQHRFTIVSHVKDKALLELIQKHFGVGKIYKHGPQSVQLRVSSKEDLPLIFQHFDIFGLITQKGADFVLQKQIFKLIQAKEHLTEEGLCKIIAIKASMNRDLSCKLQSAFPDVVPVVRPLVRNQKISDPNWLAGFTSAEGCFLINIQKSQTEVGHTVYLVFKLSQHARDKQLMICIKDFLNCGNVYSNRTWIDYSVSKLDDIENKIIPLFIKYPIRGIKAEDFHDWCIVAEMMRENKHLSKKGLEKIKQIKAGMNTGRKF